MFMINSFRQQVLHNKNMPLDAWKYGENIA